MTIKQAKKYLQGAIDAINDMKEDDYEKSPKLQELYEELAGYFF